MMRMILPDTISTTEDLRIVATLMKEYGIQVPIMGYTVKNGQQRSVKAGIARANAAGDDNEIEERNVACAFVPISSIYPQIINALHAHTKTA